MLMARHPTVTLVVDVVRKPARHAPITLLSDAVRKPASPVFENREETAYFFTELQTMYGLPHYCRYNETELPEWLANANLTMRARIVDYYEPALAKFQLRDYLERLGFEVKTDTSEHQLDRACGIVGVAASMIMAGTPNSNGETADDWWMAETADAASEDHVWWANVEQAQWKPEEAHFSNRTLQKNPLSTRNLWTDEVRRLAELRWQPYAPEGAVEKSLDEWLTITFLDATLFFIVKHLHEVATAVEGAPEAVFHEPMRCIIANTDISASIEEGRDLEFGEGQHWFTVAYDISKGVVDAHE